MQVRFSFKQVPSSDKLKTYAEQKVRKMIEKFVTKPIEAHITFSTDRHLQNAHCAVSGGDGFNIQAEASCDDVYGSVDSLMDKLRVQLKRQKEKIKNHKAGKGIKEIVLDLEADETDETDETD